MPELKDVTGMVVAMFGKAVVIELVGMLDLWEAPHHLTTHKAHQCVRAKIHKPGMQEPWLIILPCFKANRLHKVKIKKIESVPGFISFGKETTLTVADARDPIVDRHLATTLI